MRAAKNPSSCSTFIALPPVSVAVVLFLEPSKRIEFGHCVFEFHQNESSPHSLSAVEVVVCTQRLDSCEEERIQFFTNARSFLWEKQRAVTNIHVLKSSKSVQIAATTVLVVSEKA